MKTKNKGINLPRRAIFLSLILGTIIIALIVWISIVFGSATSNLKTNLYSKFSIGDDDPKPEIVKYDKFKDFTIDLKCTAYQKATLKENVDEDASESDKVNKGSMKFKLSMEGVQNNQSTTDVNAKLCIACKGTDYVSSTSSSYSFNNLVDQSAKTPTINSITQVFPMKGYGGLKTIKNPDAYLYVTYNLKGTAKQVIVYFPFDVYFEAYA